MKIVFVDTEYTGEHALTTLVSIGMVTLEGEPLYVTLNDYDRDQVFDWLRENVLALIDARESVSKREALSCITLFLEKYSEGKPISLVSAGKATDLILLFQLWHLLRPQEKYFHFLYGLPDYLCHRHHMDLDTLFIAAGIDPAIDRDQFVDKKGEGTRHNALHDACVVRECFLKLVKAGHFPKMQFTL